MKLSTRTLISDRAVYGITAAISKCANNDQNELGTVFERVTHEDTEEAHFGQQFVISSTGHNALAG